MKSTNMSANDITRAWHLIDLTDQTLGRVSTKIATLLIGKHKQSYVPHLDCGDYVVITNAAKFKVTGNKLKGKLYRSHSGYPGGFKEWTLGEQLEKDPKKIILESVKGMLPKNKLRAPRLKRLKVFVDEAHTYANELGLTKK